MPKPDSLGRGRVAIDPAAQNPHARSRIQKEGRAGMPPDRSGPQYRAAAILPVIAPGFDSEIHTRRRCSVLRRRPVRKLFHSGGPCPGRPRYPQSQRANNTSEPRSYCKTHPPAEKLLQGSADGKPNSHRRACCRLPMCVTRAGVHLCDGIRTGRTNPSTHAAARVKSAGLPARQLGLSSQDPRTGERQRCRSTRLGGRVFLRPRRSVTG